MNWLTVIMAMLGATASYIPPVHGICVSSIVSAAVAAAAHVMPAPSATKQ